MPVSIRDRIRNAWNAFQNGERLAYRDYGQSSSYPIYRPRMIRGSDRTTVSSVYNKIAIDVSAIDIEHVRLDEQGRYTETLNTGLNNCLTLEANIDQTSRAFIQDVVMSMLDEGVVAILPVDTDSDATTGSFDIYSMRVGKIVDWYPRHVKIRAYNDRTGNNEEVIMPKEAVAIIENPLYAVMNEPNSTVQRLIHKLSLLDIIDEQSASGKLDLIIQLPYTVKTPIKRAQAEERRKDIEAQLTGSRYGIAYIDSTEHITQLNRSLENNLLKQIESLYDLFYSQLGINQAVMDGTADEQTMLNYTNQTIEPIISAIVLEMRRKFLTKTARTQRESIAYFKDPFKLVPVSQIAEIADKMTRNEIMTSNEIRQVIGLMPSKDPSADELRNKNLSQPVEERKTTAESGSAEKLVEEHLNDSLRNT